MDTDIERLFKLDLFLGLTDSQKSTLSSATRIVHLKQGEILFEQGTPATTFYFVLEGWVSVLRLHESGASTVLHVFGTDESIAEVAAMGFGEYPAAAEAATDASVVSIPATVYRKLIEEDASFAMRVIGSLAYRMRVLIVDFESSQHASGANRLASFLLELTNKNQAEDGHYSLPFSKQVLAARLHMKPETLSRAFSDLRSYGIESSRDGHVYIKEIEKLKDLLKH